MPDILLVDDDRELCELLSDYLKQQGFTVRAVHNGIDGLHTATRASPDLVVCDIMMPGLDGLQVLRALRSHGSIPVLMLSAKRAESERIAGLELGADDYLSKPFSPPELVARIRAILRRAAGQVAGNDSITQDVVSVGDLSIDPPRQRVHIADQPIELTSTEIDLLACLVKRAGEAVDRRVLFQTVLGREPSPEDRGLDMMVSRVRRKLGLHADGRPRIRSIRSLGYTYVLP